MLDEIGEGMSVEDTVSDNFEVPDDVRQVLVTDLRKDEGRVYVCDIRYALGGLREDGSPWWHVQVSSAVDAALRLDELGWRMSVEAGAWVRKTGNVTSFDFKETVLIDIERAEIRSTPTEDRVRLTLAKTSSASHARPTILIASLPAGTGRHWLQLVRGSNEILRSSDEQARMVEYSVLYEVKNNGPVSAYDVAKSQGMELSTVEGVLDRFFNQGKVTIYNKDLDMGMIRFVLAETAQ